MSKRKTALVVAFVVIGVTALGLAAAVYAKYIASFSVKNNSVATVAKWNFENENENGNVICELTGTYDSTKLVNGKIAPGTTGTCAIELKNLSSEVGVSYTVKVSSFTGAPQNLVLNEHGTNNVLTTTSGSISGSLNINGTATVNVDWEWPYETGSDETTIASEDAEDTSDGENASGSAMAIEFAIEGVQINPAN